MGSERKGGGRKPIAGFRPGKEPPELRKRRAKARLGDDATWAQKKMVDVVAGRSPGEVRAMVKRWTTALLVAAVVLAVGGGLLYAWSLWAGVATHVFTVAVAFLWFRLRSRREGLVEMAEWVRRG